MDHNIELHIDELVLHGFSAAEAPYIKAAIEQRLGTLLTSQGLPAGMSFSSEIDRINAGTMQAATSAEATGVGIADRIFEGLRR